MSTLQAVAAFIGVWIGLFFSITGLVSMVAMFINKDQSRGDIVLASCLTAFGITITIAILKPI